MVVILAAIVRLRVFINLLTVFVYTEWKLQEHLVVQYGKSIQRSSTTCVGCKLSYYRLNWSIALTPHNWCKAALQEVKRHTRSWKRQVPFLYTDYSFMQHYGTVSKAQQEHQGIRQPELKIPPHPRFLFFKEVDSADTLPDYIKNS